MHKILCGLKKNTVTLVEGIGPCSLAPLLALKTNKGRFFWGGGVVLFFSFETCSNTYDLYLSDMDVHVCIFKVRDASCTQTSLGQCKC